MTAWWMRTTSVRKVRVRSRAKLRAFTFVAVPISADATGLEIDVMQVPANDGPDVAAGNLIQQGRILALHRGSQTLTANQRAARREPRDRSRAALRAACITR